MISLQKIRYALARPLQKRLLPSFIPVVPLPYLKHLPYVTVGQVVLLLPLVVCVLAGYQSTFVDPDIESSGYAATAALIYTFLAANKTNSIFNVIFGLSFERVVYLHNLASLVTLTLSLFHGYVAYLGYGGSGDSGDEDDRRLDEASTFALNGLNPNLLKFSVDGPINTTGTLLTVCIGGLILLSFFRVLRHFAYGLWLSSHIILAVGAVAFCVMHGVGLILIAALWWAMDLMLRYVVSWGSNFSGKATFTLVRPDVFEIRFPKGGLRYSAGQYVRVCVPKLNFEFHPVTISSAPHEDDITVHFKTLGNWTRCIAKLLEEEAGLTQEMHILVEGPFGNVSMDLSDNKQYPIVLCISSGIGVTPNISIAKHLLHRHRLGDELSKLYFVWILRDFGLTEALPPPSSDKDPFTHEIEEEERSDSSEAVVRSDVYVTRGKVGEADASPFNSFSGRPDLSKIIAEVAAKAEEMGVTHVAVSLCGPVGMIDDVKRLCRSFGQFSCFGGVTFAVHDEVFEY